MPAFLPLRGGLAIILNSISCITVIKFIWWWDRGGQGIQSSFHKVYSWSLCASSRINRFFVRLEMSFCPFTYWGVFGSNRITVLWWITKKMCTLWATLCIQLHQLQEVCMRQCILVDCWLMSLLLRYIDWILKYIFCCGCVNGTGWHKLGLNSLLWGTTVHLAYLTT